LDSVHVGEEYTDAAVLSPDVLFATNFNAMPFFLIANLLTGLINLSTDTTQYVSSTGFLVLSVYTVVLSSGTMSLYWWNIKIPWEIPKFSKQPIKLSSESK
jgi:hypothetical protein